MKVTIINTDKLVIVDGESLTIDFKINANIHAIQWSGKSGHIEYSDGKPNKIINSFESFKSIIDLFNLEKQRLENAEIQAEKDRIASLTWLDKRKAKYDALNQFEMQFDDAINGTTTWIDAIKAIKLEIPKTAE